MSPTATQTTSPRKGRVKWLVIPVLLVLAVLAVIFFGWLPRHKRDEEIDQKAKQEKNALPKVEVVKAQFSPTASELMVPGTTSPITQAFIYARANGYVSRRLADIGDHVRKGQLLAVIDAPDLDQQVQQGRAALEQSKNNLNQLQAQLRLATVTWDRWKVLVAKGVFSRQDGDQQEANYHVAQANVRAAENTVSANQANLDRLIALQQFEQVRAPFDGIVTARNVDVGALITAQGSGLGAGTSDQGGTQAAGQTSNGGSTGSASSSASPTTGGAQGGEMFAIAKIDRLRILVAVPESYASSVRTGQKTELSFQALPKQSIQALVTRTAGSVDQNTRTLLVEVQVDNRNRILLPGAYVTVNFIGTEGQRPLLVPGESIVVRNSKTVVAVVENNFVHFKPVEIGRDYGPETEIVDGLNPGEVIAVNVSDDVRDGGKIEPQFQKKSGGDQPGGQSDKKGSGQGQYGEQGIANQPSKAAGKQGGGSGKK